MMQIKTDLKFVEHSHGEYEGTTYDNVMLSNGIRTLSFKNMLPREQVELLKEMKEGETITAIIEVSFGKKSLVGKLIGIE